MKEYVIERTFQCTLVNTSHVETVKARYNVRELDDGYTVMELIHDSIQLLSVKEGHA